MNKTITEMQIIFNIANMRQKITGIMMDLDRLYKYDVATMDEDELSDLQDSLIPHYNKSLTN
jgi:hypothetical protein